MIQAVVFDVAGTTVNEQNVVYKTVHECLYQAGFDVPLGLVLLHAAGKEKREAIRSVLEQFANQKPDAQLINDIHRQFEQALDNAYRQMQPLPMPGAEEVFGQLHTRGIKVVLNTGYKSDIAHLLLNKLDWMEGETYDLLITADDVQRSRPHPDMILLAMQRLGITDPSTVAKVGDTIIDIQEGQNAGCGICAGITTGAQTEEQLRSANPTHVLHSLEELLEIIPL